MRPTRKTIMLHSSSRTSLVDVFEHCFEANIQSISSNDIVKMSRGAFDEVVQRIDKSLIDACDQDFPDHAILLDGMADPVLCRDDPQLKTRRAAKQAALMHEEVVVPILPLHFYMKESKDRSVHIANLASLLQWTQQNEPLLRRHIVTLVSPPSATDVLGRQEVVTLSRELAEALMRPEFCSFRSKYVPANDRCTAEEFKTIDAIVCSALGDITNSCRLNTNLAFLDQMWADVYSIIVQMLRRSESVDVPDHFDLERLNMSGPNSQAQVLQTLEVPAIDDIADEDFIAIRLNSDDFHALRASLRRVLTNTQIDLRAGLTLKDAFRKNTTELVIRARELQGQLRDKSLLSFLRSNAQTVTLGAVTQAASTIVADMALGQPHAAYVAAQFLSQLAFGILLTALAQSPTRRVQRQLRFYEALVDPA